MLALGVACEQNLTLTPHTCSQEMSSAPPAKKKKTGSSDAEKVWSVGFLGCGNMARAIVEGMLRSGTVRSLACVLKI